GLNSADANGEFVVKATDGTKKLGAQIKDPLGRYDFAGRPIHHAFVIPENMAEGINTPDDVRAKIWPKVKDTYDAFYKASEVRHSDMMSSYLAHGLEGSM